MMLYPAMNTLTKNVPNRYLLVNVVARRARHDALSSHLLQLVYQKNFRISKGF